MLTEAQAKLVNERARYGQLELGELTALAEALLEFPWRPEHFIIEIGTYKGRTPVMMARVLETIGVRPKILSIDAFDRVIKTPLNCRGSYAETITNILEAGLGAQCLVLSAASTDAAPFVPAGAGALIIDGWHDYDQVKADLENYTPKVADGGFILVDDYCQVYSGLRIAVDEFLARSAWEVSRAESKWLILRK
jgi:cephalosporin hydroxylase